MKDILYIDRETGQKDREKVYKEGVLRLLYGDSCFNRFLGLWFLPLLARWPYFSRVYGWVQKSSFSKKKIKPFIDTFHVNASEFLEPIDNFHSFNDFFIRKLRPEVRPIASGANVAIIPADGRYYFYSNVEESPACIVKGQKFELHALLGDSSLAEKYSSGSMVIARLCPSDYHRFHFPCECRPGPTRVINGWLYSVNPLALKKNIHTLSENKRTLCELETSQFGRVLFLAIGATNVGSIKETYIPDQLQNKGAEKGYFEFGGSALILLFQKNSIVFDSDLLAATQSGIEIRCLFGQSMGRSVDQVY